MKNPKTIIKENNALKLKTYLLKKPIGSKLGSEKSLKLSEFICHITPIFGCDWYPDKVTRQQGSDAHYRATKKRLNGLISILEE